MQASVLGKLWLSSRLQRIAGPLSLVLVTLFFAIDFAFPLGYSYALFYVIAILVGFFSRSPAWIKATTAASIVVTLLNPLLSGLPVLYASGYTENAIMHHGRLEPGVLLLAKPYRRAELASKLRQALAEAEPRAEQ